MLSLERIRLTLVEAPLDLEEAAQYLGCSVSTLRRLVRAKLIPHFRHSSQGKIYLDKKDLEAYKEARKEAPQP
jgi:excisionase family DNA binding protein